MFGAKWGFRRKKNKNNNDVSAADSSVNISVSSVSTKSIVSNVGYGQPNGDTNRSMALSLASHADRSSDDSGSDDESTPVYLTMEETLNLGVLDHIDRQIAILDPADVEQSAEVDSFLLFEDAAFDEKGGLEMVQQKATPQNDRLFGNDLEDSENKENAFFTSPNKEDPKSPEPHGQGDSGINQTPGNDNNDSFRNEQHEEPRKTISASTETTGDTPGPSFSDDYSFEVDEGYNEKVERERDELDAVLDEVLADTPAKTPPRSPPDIPPVDSGEAPAITDSQNVWLNCLEENGVDLSASPLFTRTQSTVPSLTVDPGASSLTADPRVRPVPSPGRNGKPDTDDDVTPRESFAGTPSHRFQSATISGILKSYEFDKNPARMVYTKAGDDTMDSSCSIIESQLSYSPSCASEQSMSDTTHRFRRSDDFLSLSFSNTLSSYGEDDDHHHDVPFLLSGGGDVGRSSEEEDEKLQDPMCLLETDRREDNHQTSEPQQEDITLTPQEEEESGHVDGRVVADSMGMFSYNRGSRKPLRDRAGRDERRDDENAGHEDDQAPDESEDGGKEDEDDHRDTSRESSKVKASDDDESSKETDNDDDEEDEGNEEQSRESTTGSNQERSPSRLGIAPVQRPFTSADDVGYVTVASQRKSTDGNARASPSLVVLCVGTSGSIDSESPRQISQSIFETKEALRFDVVKSFDAADIGEEGSPKNISRTKSDSFPNRPKGNDPHIDLFESRAVAKKGRHLDTRDRNEDLSHASFDTDSPRKIAESILEAKEAVHFSVVRSFDEAENKESSYNSVAQTTLESFASSDGQVQPRDSSGRRLVQRPGVDSPGVPPPLSPHPISFANGGTKTCATAQAPSNEAVHLGSASNGPLPSISETTRKQKENVAQNGNPLATQETVDSIFMVSQSPSDIDKDPYKWAYLAWYRKGLLDGNKWDSVLNEKPLSSDDDDDRISSSLVPSGRDLVACDFGEVLDKPNRPASFAHKLKDRRSLPAAPRTIGEPKSASRRKSFANIMKMWRDKSEDQPLSEFLSPEHTIKSSASGRGRERADFADTDVKSLALSPLMEHQTKKSVDQVLTARDLVQTPERDQYEIAAKGNPKDISGMGKIPSDTEKVNLEMRALTLARASSPPKSSPNRSQDQNPGKFKMHITPVYSRTAPTNPRSEESAASKYDKRDVSSIFRNMEGRKKTAIESPAVSAPMSMELGHLKAISEKDSGARKHEDTPEQDREKSPTFSVDLMWQHSSQTDDNSNTRDAGFLVLPKPSFAQAAAFHSRDRSPDVGPGKYYGRRRPVGKGMSVDEQLQRPSHRKSVDPRRKRNAAVLDEKRDRRVSEPVRFSSSPSKSQGDYRTAVVAFLGNAEEGRSMGRTSILDGGTVKSVETNSQSLYFRQGTSTEKRRESINTPSAVALLSGRKDIPSEIAVKESTPMTSASSMGWLKLHPGDSGSRATTAQSSPRTRNSNLRPDLTMGCSFDAEDSVFSEDDDQPCECVASLFSENDELANFFLPKMGMACTCGKRRLGLVDPNEPTALRNILRPWQVRFLAGFGISRGDQLVKANHRSAQALATSLRQYRRKHHMTAFRTKSCGMAIQIWSRTAKTFVRSIRKQLVEGTDRLEPPNTMEILSSFLDKMQEMNHPRPTDDNHNNKITNPSPKEGRREEI